jgi:hypothetical protein
VLIWDIAYDLALSQTSDRSSITLAYVCCPAFNERLMNIQTFLNPLSVSYSMILQIRRGRKPDGVCLVVGTCARGFENNSNSDVIFSSSTVKRVGDSKAQYFWEVTFYYIN